MTVKLEDSIVTQSQRAILAGKGNCPPEERSAEAAARKRVSIARLIPARRPDTGVDEWLAAMVRGLDALEFLERSRESLPD